MASHSHHHDHGSLKNIKIAFLLNLVFTIIEIIGAILTNSVAILSDALHDLGDTISLGISYYFEKKSFKGSSTRFSYGYRRFSTLAALINGVILVGGSLYILSEAIPRLIHPEDVDPKGMFFLALLGLLFNGLAALRLQKGKSINEEMISWHFIEDILGWAAVLIVSIVLMFQYVPVLDPILSIIITIFISWNVLKRIKVTLKIFLQGTPDEIDINQIKEDIIGMPNVVDMHDTHVWTLDGRYNIISTHLVVDEAVNLMQANQIKDQVKQKLQQLAIQHSTIEIEKESDHCEQVDCTEH